MYDMHYDLLTILYFNLFKQSIYSNPLKCINDIKNIYSLDNIRGGIINLYFMSEKEMKDELDIDKEELYDVVTMFKNSIKCLSYLKEQKIIPPSTDFLYSIEGCDYINNLSQIEELYTLGLRSIMPVWNNENIYGSGIKTDKGLTLKGKELIKKAIDLGIIIDLSHANSKTYDDIINIIIEEQANGKNTIVIASHSNCKSLCDRKRNLTDEQLLKLRDVGGTIGLFSNSKFLSTDFVENTYVEKQKMYLEHIKHVIKLGFPVDKIVLSTDDMNFSKDITYHGNESFNLDKINHETYNLLNKDFSEENVKKLMYKNAKNIFDKVR